MRKRIVIALTIAICDVLNNFAIDPGLANKDKTVPNTTNYFRYPWTAPLAVQIAELQHRSLAQE